MEKYWELYLSKEWVEPFLVYFMLLFVLIAFILFIRVLLSRQKHQRLEKLKVYYREITEKILLSVLFKDISYADILKQEAYSSLIHDKLFRKVLMKSVINLHHNYEGAYAEKLERFYKESELIDNSFRRLKSHRWEVQCKAATELAEMNVEKAFNMLGTLSQSKNKILKINALKACIKLNSTNGFQLLVNHPDPIDEWSQINIIDTLKQKDISHAHGIELLLESKNASVVLLGLKIILAFHLTNKVKFIHKLAENTSNNTIKAEAGAVMAALSTKNLQYGI